MEKALAIWDRSGLVKDVIPPACLNQINFLPPHLFREPTRRSRLTPPSPSFSQRG